MLSRGIEVLASDEIGVTLELRTEAFDVQTVVADEREFERLRIGEYIHGFTHEPGRPQLPVKGLLLDVPPGKAAKFSVLQTEVQPHSGFRVYPVPQNMIGSSRATPPAWRKSLSWMKPFTRKIVFIRPRSLKPANAMFSGIRPNSRFLFYPLAFNPATGDLTLYTRIRVRVDYVDAGPAGRQRAAAGGLAGADR